jgi:surfeit locus 1 family protein
MRRKERIIMRLRKPETIPVLFIIFTFSLLMGLGIWQVERLQWKNAQVASIKAAQELPVLGTLPQDITGLDYRHVALTGSFMHDKSFHLVGRPQGAGQGFFIVTPFVLDDDGRIILVNRGFAENNKESRPEGPQTVTGIIRPLRLKRMFMPENVPAKNVWFYEDMDAMSQASGLTLIPIMVEAVGKAEKNVYPTPSNGKIVLRNDHLNYAITWFSLALIALVMFVFYHRIPDEKK